MNDDTVPDDLADWSLHCFCIAARRTPHAVIRLDSNGRLLLAASRGIALSELRERGLLVADSQLLLLREFGLVALEREDPLPYIDQYLASFRAAPLGSAPRSRSSTR